VFIGAVANFESRRILFYRNWLPARRFTTRLLNEGVEKLKNIAAQSVYTPPIALTPFLQASNAALETLIVLGPDCLDEFPEDLIPRICLF
jgi:hypothetical protein